ncbi:porin [Sphingomonas immobilis]|uniref:Porin n=1 Tax=Sphingomonas immobilis TaxID=3063997 RepID=A0ABT9A3W5_9SPHN|nr:porin [Sphingomonas sp. CA1-15]MDO7843905.1 porin [Sphingomonas sp. CA1-15]
MRGITKLLTASCAVALLAAATPAFAQDDATSALLLRLKEKGILTEAEYNDLIARKAPPAPVAVTTNASADPQATAAAQLDEKRMVRMTESGVGMEFAGVTLKFSGQVNGFYVHDSPDKRTVGTTVVGGLANVGTQNSSAIRNGLLPGNFGVDVSTNQGGWDVAAHFGFYPGINSNSYAGNGANAPGAPYALATSGIDARQTYLTIGKPQLGTLKLGRDIGLFGSDAILNDITLLAVGSSGNNAGPSNTSLGRIGTGYLYTDFQPQITYTSPKFAGFQASVGVFQPLSTLTGGAEVNGTPGFQGKITYDFKADQFSGHLWASGISQRHDGFAGTPSYTGSGFDVGAKLSYGPISAVGYYYRGSGLGTTALFVFSTDALGRKRDSDGFYAQATATFGKFTLGGSYGQSKLYLAPGEINPTLLSKNSSWVAQARYGLTSWVTLIGEYTHTDSDAQGTNTARSNALAAGAILFF